MRIQLITITLLSQLALSTPLATVWAAPDVVVKTLPVITAEDKEFLGMKIGIQFDFPTDAKDRAINQAAFFMNDIKFVDGMTYQMMFDKLLQEDNALSKSKMIPGAFMDAAADLYEFAVDDIRPKDFSGLTSTEQDERVKKEQKNFKDFSEILRKEAQILGSQQIPVAEAILKLKIQLEEAKKKGKPYKKVYIYSDGDTYKDDYYRLRDEYPGLDIEFRVFDPDIDVFFRESEAIDDGYVYIDRIPGYYAPLYSSIWYPFYDKFYEDDSYFLGFGYPYAIYDYWDGYYGGYAPGYWGGWDNWSFRRFGDHDWHDHHRGDYHRDHDRDRRDFDRDRLDHHRGDGAADHQRGDRVADHQRGDVLGDHQRGSGLAEAGVGLAAGALAGAAIGRHTQNNDHDTHHDKVGKHENASKRDSATKGDKVGKHDKALKGDRNRNKAGVGGQTKGNRGERTHDKALGKGGNPSDVRVSRGGGRDHVARAPQGGGRDHAARAPQGGGRDHAARAPRGGGRDHAARAPRGGGRDHTARAPRGGGRDHGARASRGRGGGGRR